MTTNRDWLFSLPLEEQYAWMNAEHQERAHHGYKGVKADMVIFDELHDEHDSREKLEADAFAYLQTAYITYPQIIELLDRQAAITAHQWESYHNGMMLEWMAKTEELQEQVDELTAERDKLQEQLLIGWECECRLQAERERYRSKFGKCLDYADAIHALMDDEGMA